MTYKANNIKFVKIQRKLYKPSPRDKLANVHSNPEIMQEPKYTFLLCWTQSWLYLSVGMEVHTSNQ